ncbi:hypothetical protein BHM03_00029578, partial [Ensete ventricosum]
MDLHKVLVARCKEVRAEVNWVEVAMSSDKPVAEVSIEVAVENNNAWEVVVNGVAEGMEEEVTEVGEMEMEEAVTVVEEMVVVVMEEGGMAVAVAGENKPAEVETEEAAKVAAAG